MARLGLILVATALFGQVPAADAAPLQLRALGAAGGTVRSDGERLIASGGNTGPVRILDVRSGATRTLESPPGCVFSDIHRGDVLWRCSTGAEGPFGHGLTLDLATGRYATLPRVRFRPETYFSQAFYEAIGERWARVRYTGYHSTVVQYVERSSGHQVPAPQRRDRVADLDRSPLSRPLCSSQRRPYVPDELGFGTLIDELARAGGRAAATAYDRLIAQTGRVQLERCGRAPQTLRVCRTFGCSQPVLSSRLIAWVETTRARDASFTSSLVVRSLRTGRTRRTATYTEPVVPLLVGHRLYATVGDQLTRAAL